MLHLICKEIWLFTLNTIRKNCDISWHSDEWKLELGAKPAFEGLWFIIYINPELFLLIYSENGTELEAEGETKTERISYDEALTKYGTGRFLLLQFSKSKVTVLSIFA